MDLSQIPTEELLQMLSQEGTPRPTHDDLNNAAVTGQDSLELQDIDSSVKPAVKMTLAEFLGSEIPPEKPFFSIGNGEVFVFASMPPEVKETLENAIAQNESEMLGYPDREGADMDAAVTKQGDVVTDLPEMKQHADNGNLMWAAEGRSEDLLPRAHKVGKAIKNYPWRR